MVFNYINNFIYNMIKRQLVYMKKAKLALIEHFKKQKLEY